MEIRRVLTGEAAGFASSRPAGGRKEEQPSVRPSADRLELSRQWVENMEEQRAQVQAALLSGNEHDEKEPGGILGYMETEQDKLDALSEQIDVQMKCLKIAMNIMKGKKVPPEDERYLMEHDPAGYKLAMAMKVMVKEDKKECKSVLDDEDKNGGDTSDTGKVKSAFGEEAASSGGEE